MGCVFSVLCSVSRYHPGLTSEKFVIRICFKMTDSQIIYYFHPWKKFIIWDDMRKTRVRQIAFTTNLLCTSSFWKPYKVLYTSIILLLLLSFICVSSAFFIGMKIIIIVIIIFYSIFWLLTMFNRSTSVSALVIKLLFSTLFAFVSDNSLFLWTCKWIFTYENTP